MYTRFNALMIKKLYAVHENRLQYGVGRTHHSDCSENSFIIAVYEKIFSQNFLSKTRKKQLSHRQPLQNYFWSSQNSVLFIHGVQVNQDFK